MICLVYCEGKNESVPCKHRLPCDCNACNADLVLHHWSFHDDIVRTYTSAGLDLATHNAGDSRHTHVAWEIKTSPMHPESTRGSSFFFEYCPLSRDSFIWSSIGASVWPWNNEIRTQDTDTSAIPSDIIVPHSRLLRSYNAYVLKKRVTQSELYVRYLNKLTAINVAHLQRELVW